MKCPACGEYRMRMNRSLITLCIAGLTILAPLELSRVIVTDAFIRKLYEDTWRFIFELAVIWIFYLGAIVLVYRLTRKEE